MGGGFFLNCSFTQFESGVHRVQRVPATETAGRIHTSTATVVVLPQPTEVSRANAMNCCDNFYVYNYTRYDFTLLNPER